jgi:elongation factor G
VIDRERLRGALADLAAEDASFDFSIDSESGQAILKGMGELHLDIKVDILKRTCKFDLNIGEPQVAYRETIARRVTKDYTHKHQSGGSGQFARVKLVVEPNEPGKGYEFTSKIVGGAVPQEFIPGVEKGLESVLGAGVLAGFPVVDIRVELLEGAYHEIDSSADAFEIAARTALREALAEASVLLEPVMKVEVVTPCDCVERVIKDLDSRRGEIEGRDARGDAIVVTALVPLATMFGYVNVLGSMSGGRARYTTEFGHYARVPLPDDDPPFRPAAAMRA